jgi:tetratricopeptide (TPR) repeat protein
MDIMKRRPGSSLALISSTWVAKMKVREGKGIEAAELLAETLKESIGDPANEQVESLLDELVRTLVPKRSKDPVDADALFAQLKSILEKAATGQESPTTNARIAYASARLADMLRLPDRADLFLKGMAANTDPAVLSPMLLSASGEILLKDGQLDQAQAMFQRIVDRYQESAFADAGPVGLARVAMARKEYQQALDLFNEAIETSPGMSRFQEATAGKLEALTMLGKLEDAEKLGLEILGDKQFKGQTAGKAYLVLGQVFRSKASTKSGSEKEEDLKKANGYYVNAFARFKSIPDIAAEGLLKSYETLTELGDSDGATETLKILKENAKLQNTPAAKKAQTL